MATKRKYSRVVIEDQKPDQNVIRVATKAQLSNQVRKALWLLQGPRREDQPPVQDTIFITAIENAISKAVIIAEVVRRRIAGIYQINKIQAVQINEEYEPLEEGLVKVKVTKNLASLQIKLTKTPTEQDRKEPGFLEPLPADQVQPTRERNDRQRSGSRRQRTDSQRNNRDNRDRRDNRDNRDRRDNRDNRDNRDRRDYRDRRENRDNRRDDRDNRRDNRRDDRRDERDNRRDDRDNRRDDRRDNRDNRRDDRRDNNRRDDRDNNRDQRRKNDNPQNETNNERPATQKVRGGSRTTQQS